MFTIDVPVVLTGNLTINMATDEDLEKIIDINNKCTTNPTN